MYKILIILALDCWLLISCSPKATGGYWFEIDRFTVNSFQNRTSYSGYKAVRFLAEGGNVYIDSVNVISDSKVKAYQINPRTIRDGDTSRTYKFPFTIGRSERLDIYCRYKEQTLAGRILNNKGPASLIVLAYRK
jgi:hypothetical protein